MEGQVVHSDIEAPVNSLSTITEEQWTGLIQSKKDFYANKIENLNNNPYLSPEIADSWLRSRKAQVDPYDPLSKKTLSKTYLRKCREKNHQAIQIAEPLFSSFHLTRHCFNFHLLLIDQNGIILLQEGLLYKNIARKSQTILSENQLGTNANVICNILKHPVQLFGPQHYNSFLDDNVVMAAPIFNDYGGGFYNLVLSLPLIVLPWENHFQEIYTPTFSLMMATAISIETKLKQQKTYDLLELRNKHFNFMNQSGTSNSTHHGVLTIDKSGCFVEIDRDGSQLFKLSNEECKSKNISDFISKKTHLMQMIHHGVDANTTEVVSIEDEKYPSYIDIHPVKNRLTQQIIGAVLAFNINNKTKIKIGSKTNTGFQFNNLIGESAAFKKAINTGQTFACSCDNILLTGESGTGKELFAKAIHSNCRPGGPFVAINCAAMPRELIESELFGYERGSFTGADRNGRTGKIELADEGTLFLDEIGDMNLELQAVLLRVLQDKQVLRIGGRLPKTINFRLVAATNKNLQELVANHLFREDLFYRLSVLTIELPSLRARQEDIPLLCHHFVTSYCRKSIIRPPRIATPVLEKLSDYNWPGNIRQLENAIIYAINSAQGGREIELRHLPENIIFSSKTEIQENDNTTEGEHKTVQTIQDSEKYAIRAALSDAQYNVLRAANILNISKSTLYRKIKRYQIYL